jgi:hypothetical protein
VQEYQPLGYFPVGAAGQEKRQMHGFRTPWRLPEDAAGRYDHGI